MKKYYVLLVLLIYTLAGCSQQPEKSSGGTVAATVNGVEITKRQVEYLYDRAAASGMSERDAANLKRRILADLVRQELLVEKAKSMNLDKSPEFSIERFSLEKRALASLAENKLVHSKVTVTPKEAESVVLNYPDLFAKRQLYIYDLVMMKDVDSLFIDSLDKLIKQGARIDQLVGQLKTNKVVFRKVREVTPTEKLPNIFQNLMKKLKPGVPEVLIFPNNNYMILEINQSIPIPLVGLDAKRAAASMIISLRRGNLMNNQMKELVDNSEITYFDEYLNKGDDTQNLASLPEPDKEGITKKIHQRVLFGSMFFVSFALSILVLVAGIRVLYDKSWFFWLKSNAVEVSEADDKYSVRYVPPFFRRILVYALFALILYSLFKDALAVRSVLPLWMMFACMVGGTVTGLLASTVYRIESVMNWQRKTYMIVAIIMTIPFPVLMFLIKYFKAG